MTGLPFALGVDIGGTNARAAVVDAATGAVVATAKKAWVDKSPGAVVAEVTALVGEVLKGREVGAAALGVGFAGMVRGPTVVNAPNLGWRNVDFGAQLEVSLGRRVHLLNDLSAAAWGELSAGAARGAQDTLTVFVGTGVGSALIVGGALVSGATGVAGEFGHMKVVAQGGRACGCGEYGCLEAYMGGAKLTEWMREEGLEGTPQDLERAAHTGDDTAKRLYDFAVGHLALCIANQVTLLNPAVMVLGGGVLTRCPGMVERIGQVIGTRSGAASRQGLAIRLARLGDDSGIVGAALLAASSG